MLLLDHAMRPHLRSVICTRCTLSRPISHRAYRKSPSGTPLCVGREIACDDNKVVNFLVGKWLECTKSAAKGEHDMKMFCSIALSLVCAPKTRTKTTAKGRKKKHVGFRILEPLWTRIFAFFLSYEMFLLGSSEKMIAILEGGWLSQKAEQEGDKAS